MLQAPRRRQLQDLSIYWRSFMISAYLYWTVCGGSRGGEADDRCVQWSLKFIHVYKNSRVDICIYMHICITLPPTDGRHESNLITWWTNQWSWRWWWRLMNEHEQHPVLWQQHTIAQHRVASFMKTNATPIMWHFPPGSCLHILSWPVLHLLSGSYLHTFLQKIVAIFLGGILGIPLNYSGAFIFHGIDLLRSMSIMTAETTGLSWQIEDARVISNIIKN